jgi:hypothetical protein
MEQILFFHHHDIIISPHGAQITGIPFMKSPCSIIIELFPKGYYISYYFGSLESSSNIQQRRLQLIQRRYYIKKSY